MPFPISIIGAASDFLFLAGEDFLGLYPKVISISTPLAKIIYCIVFFVKVNKTIIHDVTNNGS